MSQWEYVPGNVGQLIYRIGQLVQIANELRERATSLLAGDLDDRKRTWSYEALETAAVALLQANTADAYMFATRPAGESDDREDKVAWLMQQFEIKAAASKMDREVVANTVLELAGKIINDAIKAIEFADGLLD